MIFRAILLATFGLFPSIELEGKGKQWEIWLDGDFSNHEESSKAIKMGAEAAIRDFGGTIHGRPIVIIEKDHRGSSKRSRRNIEKFIKSENGVTMMSGIHSPPLLEHKDFINQSKTLFLVPWAAAGPITRSSKDKENYIFRLSIDDSKAGAFLSGYAAKTLKSKKPCLLLEETGWGRSNHKNMTSGFKKAGIKVHDVKWFKWGVAKNVAREISSDLYKKGCDLVLLVANAKEGAVLVKSIADYPAKEALPILSHWGITGGNFHKNIPYEIRDRVNLKFIQTKVNFIQASGNKKATNLIASLIKHEESVSNARDINAGTGVSHAYDLTSLFLKAFEKINVSQDPVSIRQSLKISLENLKTPFQGLFKVYKKPFGLYKKSRPNAHEALGPEDYAIGKFDKEGVIINVK